MDLAEAVGWFRANRRGFFHFTDVRNLASIREHGLLSMRELRERQLALAAPGGNDWSLEQDVRTGMDAYVHLCFRPQHPMEYLAKQDGRIETSRFVRVAPEVLLIPGVLICDQVANKRGAQPDEPLEMLRKLDLEVLYSRTDWRDPAIKERLKIARCYEILVPTRIPLDLLSNL